MIKYNYHGHTRRCGHADFSLIDEDYVKKFILEGFKVIAFTDHVPHKKSIDNQRNMRMNYQEKDEYLESINLLKEKYKDKIKILVGFEIEYLDSLVDYLENIKKDVDILVLGQHFIYDEKINGLKILRKDIFSNEDTLNYAKHISKALDKGLVNVVAHPDIFVLGRNEFNEIDEKATRMICESSLRNNVPLEINLTEGYLFLNGIIDKVRYPSKDFWKIVSNYNVKVVYGIDAHNLEQIDFYEKSIDLIKEIIGKDIIDKLNIVDTL